MAITKWSISDAETPARVRKRMAGVGAQLAAEESAGLKPCKPKPKTKSPSPAGASLTFA
jgi:hypothetical protein